MENLVVKIDSRMANATWISNFTDETAISGATVKITSTGGFTGESVNMGVVLRILVHVVLIVAGLVLNSVVVVVYSKKLRKSTYLMVTVLAVCDILNCAGQTLEVLKLLGLNDQEKMETICFVRHGFVCFMTLVSVGLVMFVAIDRYLKIRYYRSSIRLSRKHCFWLIFGVLLTSTFVTSPFVVTHSTNVLPRNGFCLRQAKEAEMADNKIISTGSNIVEFNQGVLTGNKDMFLFIFYVVMLLCIFAAFLVMTVFYIKLGRILMKKTSLKRSSIASSREDSDMSLCTTDDESTSCKSENSTKKTRYFRKYRVGFTGDLSRIVNEKAVINKFQTQLHNDECFELGDISEMPSSVRTSTPKREERRASRNDVTSASRRKSATLSIASSSKSSSGKYSRTVVMITLAILLCLLYIGNTVTHLVNVLNNDFFQRFPTIFEICENIQTLCYIFNPVLYAFFNRGFARRMRICCFGRAF